jgi:SAM-dependent methyltransferase
MPAANLRSVDSHFAFGENWLDYAAGVDEEAKQEAEKGLLKLFPRGALVGARFLDIGCGSGLHSLAALRLGVAGLTAIDIDANSVKATLAMISSEPGGPASDVRAMSIFDADPEEFGTFDIVYSWGVLHHTGAMWEAVERAARFVRPGGLFGLALYEKCPSCAFWKAEKRLYSRSPAAVQKAMRGLYKAAFYARLVAKRTSPASYLGSYKSRGMSFHHDVHDWMGGYPYESASVDEVRSRMGDLGFEIVRLYPANPRLGLFGTGCAEFTLRRTEPAGPSLAPRET